MKGCNAFMWFILFWLCLPMINAISQLPWTTCDPPTSCFRKRTVQCKIGNDDVIGLNCVGQNEPFEEIATTGCDIDCIANFDWNKVISTVIKTCNEGSNCFDSNYIQQATCSSNSNCYLQRKHRCYDVRTCGGNPDVWTPTGSLSQCSVTCGGGTQTRERVCWDIHRNQAGTNCAGNAASSITFSCNNQACPSWSTWTSSSCSRSCRGGVKQLTSRCIYMNQTSTLCPDSGGLSVRRKNEFCNVQTCPPDVYGEWSQWSDCDSCQGDRTRFRNCTSCSEVRLETTTESCNGSVNCLSTTTTTEATTTTAPTITTTAAATTTTAAATATTTAAEATTTAAETTTTAAATTTTTITAAAATTTAYSFLLVTVPTTSGQSSGNTTSETITAAKELELCDILPCVNWSSWEVVRNCSCNNSGKAIRQRSCFSTWIEENYNYQCQSHLNTSSLDCDVTNCGGNDQSPLKNDNKHQQTTIIVISAVASIIVLALIVGMIRFVCTKTKHDHQCPEKTLPDISTMSTNHLYDEVYGKQNIPMQASYENIPEYIELSWDNSPGNQEDPYAIQNIYRSLPRVGRAVYENNG